MKFSFAVIAVAALASRAIAQTPDLSGLPTCAETAAISGISSTGCALTDFACICKSTSFIDSVAAAIKTVCSPADQAKTIAFAQKLCASVGVTISTPGGGASSTSAVVSPPSSSVPASVTTSVISYSSVSVTSTLAPAPTTNVTSNATVSTIPAPTQANGAAYNAASWLLGAAMAGAAVFAL